MEVDTDSNEKTLNVEMSIVNLEFAEDPNSNDAKICSPEISDVFPIFVNMLDLKSFMNLAMTCKGMYKRCMEDKAIRINVNEDTIAAMRVYGSAGFSFLSFTVGYSHNDSYLAALRKLPCKVSLRTVEIRDDGRPDFSIIDAAIRYVKELKVGRIERVCFDDFFTDWEAIIPFIKKFHTVRVCFRDLKANVPVPILRSILQMNLEKLAYKSGTGVVPIDLLLESDTAIQKFHCTAIRNIEKEILMELLSKIQTGSFNHITIHSNSVNWNDFERLPFDYGEGPLPEDRPILFGRTLDNNGIREYWFLHWHGNVTKCVEKNQTLEMFKCEPSDYPWILRTEEEVLKDLSEKRQRVLCSAAQFTIFTSGFQMLSPSHKGPLPQERPLYCSVVDENFFWLLDKEDFLMKCYWNDGCAKWEPFSTRGEHIGHAALVKFFFWKLLKNEMEKKSVIYCEGLKEFDSWFENCEKFDFDYLGTLPSTRPLAFERTSSEDKLLRVVLLEERTVQCKVDGDHHVKINRCSAWNSPAILVTAEVIKKILLLWDNIDEKVDVLVDYNIFGDGFEKLKSSSSVFVYQRTIVNSFGERTDERWYSSHGNIRKAVWKDGRFLLSFGDLREFPEEFVKHLFRVFAEAEYDMDSLFLDYERFHRCLEQFTVVPFEYSGPLTSHLPLAFEKKVFPYDTADFFVHVWFLLDDLRTTYCSWKEGEEGKKGSQKLDFERSPEPRDMPPALKTTEHLRSLFQQAMQVKFDEEQNYQWHGPIDGFRACLSEYKLLPLDYEGRLPDERPLVFEGNLTDEEIYCLREDGTVIKIYSDQHNSETGTVRVLFTLTSRFDFLPLAITRSPSTAVYFPRFGICCIL